MQMFLLWIGLQGAMAEEMTPEQAELNAIDVLLPDWAAKNAALETKLSQAHAYLEAGAFFKAFPQWANQPLLSLLYLKGILNEIQEKEITLNIDNSYKQCLLCSDDINQKLDIEQEKYLQLQHDYIALQRQNILQLYAALKKHPGLQEHPIEDYRAGWTDDFQYFEHKLLQMEDQDSELYRRSEAEFRFIGQHLSTLIELERVLIEQLMHKDTKRLQEWFQHYFESALEYSNLRQQRAALDLVDFYNVVVADEDKSLTELAERLKSSYLLSIGAINDGYLLNIREMESLDLKDRLEQTAEYLSEIADLIEENSWIEKELIETQSQLLLLEKELKSAIQREEELSQESHQQEVLLAEKALEEARNQRLIEQEQIDAEVQDIVISIREEIQKVRSRDQDIRTWIQDRIDFYDQTLQSNQADFEAALEKSSLSLERQNSLDNLYLGTDDLLRLIRADLIELEEKSEIFSLQMRFDEPQINPPISSATLQSFKQAESDYTQAFKDNMISRKEEVYTLFRRIEDIKELRRELKITASGEALFSAQDDFWFELYAELSEQPIHTRFWFSEQYGTIKALPRQMMRFDVLSRAFSQLLFLLLLLGGWNVVRRYSTIIIRKLKSYVQTDFLFGWEDEPLTESTVNPSLSYAIDALFGIIIYLWIHDLYPLMALIILIGEGVILWRWRQLLFHQIDIKLIQTLFYTTSIVYTYLFLNDISIIIMSADRLSEFISFVIGIACIPFVLWLLWNWSETAEAHTNHWVEGNRFFHWLDQHISHVFFRKMMWSCIGIGMLIYQMFIYLSLLIIESTGWFGDSLSDNKTKRIGSEQDRNMAEHVFSKLELLYQMGSESQKILALIEEWSKNKNNGVIGVIGDRGSGKTTLLKQINVTGYQTSLLIPKKRIYDMPGLHHWMADELGLSLNDNIVDALYGLESRIIVLDRLNFFFLRGMHGYDALYELSRIMQHTAHHHCWIVSIHLFSWNFLRSKAIPFKTDVFYSTLHIGEMNVQKCMQWSNACASEHDVKIDFTKLNPRYKTENFVKQVRKSYWRLLVDSSIQNPSAIRRSWIQSLEYSEDTRTFFVHAFKMPSSEIIQSLPLTELFILSTILIHGRLTCLEQSQSLNIELSEIIHSCSSLENKGILELKDEAYEIVYSWYPSIILYLQQKHMLVAS